MSSLKSAAVAVSTLVLGYALGTAVPVAEAQPKTAGVSDPESPFAIPRTKPVRHPCITGSFDHYECIYGGMKKDAYMEFGLMGLGGVDVSYGHSANARCATKADVLAALREVKDATTEREPKNALDKPPDRTKVLGNAVPDQLKDPVNTKDNIFAPAALDKINAAQKAAEEQAEKDEKIRKENAGKK